MYPTCDNVRRARPLLGTFVEITATHASRSDVDAVIDEAFDAVAEVHRLMSFHDPDSDVAQLNRWAWQRAIHVEAWTFEVLQTALDLHHSSAGLFDIAVAPILQTMGLLPASAGRAAATGPLATSAGIELCADGSVRFHHPDLTVDLGGIAKGFAVDRAVDVLRDHGIGGLVNAGGDLAAFGPDAHIVHIRDPGNPDRFIARVVLRNQALASSGGGFDPFRSASVSGATVIDPAMRAPARAIRGATVRARSCMIADALTKVVIVAGEGARQLLEQYRASAMLVTADGDIRATTNWQEASDRAA